MSELVFNLEKQASRLEDVTRPSAEQMKALADPQPKDEFSVKETQLTRFTHIAMRSGGTPPRGRMGDSVAETLHAFKTLSVEHIQLPTLRIDTPLPRESTPLSVSDDRTTPSPAPDNFNMSIDDVKRELAKIPYNFNKRRRSSIQPVHIDHPYNWHKDAIVYEVYVRGFFDSNNDGIGDIPGLTQKLDYLQWLGINCLWLLPIFKSPLRDGGYDIADYYDILPEYGTIDNFRIFLNEAHKRGIRVICDLVVNHTSDEHPWFKEACRSRDNPKRNWYVWSDTNEKFKEARVIFVDTNKSNWTWHEPTKQFYWHRFFSHQPDLNYENPEVQEVMLDVMDYWFEFGVDGFRIDAAPYLFEEDGTNCENLPQTHAYMKKMRAHVDKHYPGRLLLAEANQWPSDVIQYMGAGDECHMAYHFPIMPRIFIALRQKDRTPVVEILKNTPTIPANCQWGLFLRNHDELTLEMCTNEERDYLYNEYCKEARMRCNIGIRRRLAPLVENDRREIELLIALLFGLPGTPFLYYGDEIGMGDNIYLGDRDGVRTPMQWSSDRNGGFSRCDFAQLYFASNMDPVFGYISVNVEAQQRHSSSLLNWMRNMIIHRKKYTIFGRGSLEFLYPTNHKVLAFLRSDKEDIVMCLYNLSSTSQPVELDLSRFIGANPVEMIDGVVFPEIKDNQYQLSLGPLGWMWFHLKTKKRGMPNHGLVMGTKEDRPNSPDV